MEGDPASRLIDGIDRFLLGRIADTKVRRSERWQQQKHSDNYSRFLDERRSELREQLGMRSERVAFQDFERVQATSASMLAATDSFRIERVRWPVLPDPDPGRSRLISLTGEGLLLTPTEPPIATVIAIPDAGQTPEQICGLLEGVPPGQQFARRLAVTGCRVIVPAITMRHTEARQGRAMMTDREFAYRSGFVIGQHLLGYELQRILALVDHQHNTGNPRVGIIGYGEGGLLALLAGALDSRLAVTAVSGFFGLREQSWQEPLDRNVFGILQNCGAAELAAMTAPQQLIVDTAAGPEFQFNGNGGAPASLKPTAVSDVLKEASRARDLGARLQLAEPATREFASAEILNSLLRTLTDGTDVVLPSEASAASPDVSAEVLLVEAETRRVRQLQEMDRHNQLLLRETPFVRRKFLEGLDTSSVEAYSKSVEAWRDRFREDVIGHFDLPRLPLNAHSRQLRTSQHWTAWEIELDVFEDVAAYGVLLLPHDMKEGERRPVIVCQHGLEGRPLDTIENDHRAYHDYAAKLCEQGYVVFAPQNIYIFRDRFRTLQRKANPLGKTLFSVMVPQHQQIVDWLKTQPFVDEDRIAFYGLSYGGKSAMRIPALVTDYCLSICSADFNEWVVKNSSTRHDFSYVWTGEYEIFEWNLGRTFNYAEMAALICPRPFMVERGHFDAVGEDDWVGYEYAKVRHLYAARLKIPERTEIEWFDGPHTINGQGTFRFLQRHLKWPAAD